MTVNIKGPSSLTLSDGVSGKVNLKIDQHNVEVQKKAKAFKKEGT